MDFGANVQNVLQIEQQDKGFTKFMWEIGSWEWEASYTF
jgi:hypothetical protein